MALRLREQSSCIEIGNGGCRCILAASDITGHVTGKRLANLIEAAARAAGDEGDTRLLWQGKKNTLKSRKPKNSVMFLLFQKLGWCEIA
jgi:hypothetical protein